MALGANPERLGISGVSQGGLICYRGEFPLSGHMMRPEDWDEAIRDAADWLARFLAVDSV